MSCRNEVFHKVAQSMEPQSRPYVFQNTWETDPMNRSVALRAFFMFAVLTTLAAVTGLASHVTIAEVLFLICGSLSAMMLFLALTVPTQAPVPVRIRRRR
jgi:hypothetical protein